MFIISIKFVQVKNMLNIFSMGGCSQADPEIKVLLIQLSQVAGLHVNSVNGLHVLLYNFTCILNDCHIFAHTFYNSKMNRHIHFKETQGCSDLRNYYQRLIIMPFRGNLRLYLDICHFIFVSCIYVYTYIHIDFFKHVHRIKAHLLV